MPPPSYSSKISARSTGDYERGDEKDCDFKKSKSNSENSSSDEESKVNYKCEGVGIVKSLLGPSLEDAVLRTLEFGKSLIQKTDENEQIGKDKKVQKDFRKETKEKSKNKHVSDMVSGEGNREQASRVECKNEGRSTRKRIVFTAKLDKDIPLCNKPNPSNKKLTSVSKIRSLDSDLKQVATSPEKIKRQLEALIQINKDEPPEHAGDWALSPKSTKLPVDVTVMPSICVYKNEADHNHSSCDVQTMRKKHTTNEYDQGSTSRTKAVERTIKKKLGASSGICQAPEFISNALGPTLDVSIIDNLKMMRDLFKCESGKDESGRGESRKGESVKYESGKGENVKHESGKGEGVWKKNSPILPVKHEEHSSIRKLELEAKTRIEELQKRVMELEQKEQILIKQIEEEEKERENRRRAFEEEEKKLCNMKACLESLVQEEKKKECTRRKSPVDCKDFEAKYNALKQRIACEEEKLSRLKDQYDCYRRELMDARHRKDALKRNKSLLDAWDVIASRVCHTRLPSFSRAYHLERKQLKAGDSPGDIHCCFLTQVNESSVETPRTCGRESRSRSRCASRCGSRCDNRLDNRWDHRHVNRCINRCPSANLDVHWCKSKESQPNVKCCKARQEDKAFPIQRDVTCGLHQSLKTCSCSQTTRHEGLTCSSDDELFKKCGAVTKESKKGESNSYCLGIETPEKIIGKPPSGKNVCRSRSETAMKRDKCSKIVKVMWAVTRINIFQDNCRTYEVMDATSTPPSSVPVKTEGIFVVKNPQKKLCKTSVTNKRCHGNVSGF